MALAFASLLLPACRSPWDPADPPPCEGCESVLRGDRFFAEDAFVNEGAIVFLNPESASVWRVHVGTGDLERLGEGFFSSSDMAYFRGGAWLASSTWGMPLLRVDLASAEVTEFFPFGSLGRADVVEAGPGGSLVVSGASQEERIVATVLEDGTVGEILDSSESGSLRLVDATEEGVLWSRGDELIFLASHGEEQVLLLSQDLREEFALARIVAGDVLLPLAEHAIHWEPGSNELSFLDQMAGLSVVVPIPCGYLGLSESKESFSTFDEEGRPLRTVELRTRYSENMPSGPTVIGDDGYFIGASWMLKSPIGCAGVGQ